MKCKVQDCDDKSRSKGLCTKHYTRLWRHGCVDAVNGHRSNIKYNKLIRFSYTALNKSIRQISRELGISRWAVSKAIKG